MLKYISRKLMLGKVMFNLYYFPRGLIQNIYNRGVIDKFIDYKERRNMQHFAKSLKAKNTNEQKNEFKIYFLTGKHFWYQTCFCAYTFIKYSKLDILPVFYDDGTLEKKTIQKIKKIFPFAKFVLKDEIELNIKKSLPLNSFPYLRERRKNYPNIKKLIDIHLNSEGWKIVFDSDMLFFRYPEKVVDWLYNPQYPIHMIDVENSYGYTKELMSQLASTTIKDRVNVGITGLKSDEIDWKEIEYWCKETIENEGKHYYQEQALITMIVSRSVSIDLPAVDYIVMPDRNEVLNPKAVLHHYVADSKPWYFRHGWKHVVI